MHEENILKCAVQYCYYPSLARVIFKDVFTRNHNNQEQCYHILPYIVLIISLCKVPGMGENLMH